MTVFKVKILFLTCCLIRCLTAAAQVPTSERMDSAEIHFHQSRTQLLLDFEDNREQLSRVKNALNNKLQSDSLLYIKEIIVEGSASPEGSLKFNRWLSQERAKRIAEYLFPGEGLDNSLIHSEFKGRDWGG